MWKQRLGYTCISFAHLFLAEMPSVGLGVEHEVNQTEGVLFILGLIGPSRFVLAQYFESQQSVLTFLWPNGATGNKLYWPNSSGPPWDHKHWFEQY
jgi:hypothetical protein